MSALRTQLPQLFECASARGDGKAIGWAEAGVRKRAKEVAALVFHNDSADTSSFNVAACPFRNQIGHLHKPNIPFIHA